MEYVTLGEHCDITSSKRVFANQYVDEGIPFYRSREIIEKKEMKDISEPLFISEDLYDTFKKKFGVPQKGDLLLTSVGTLGIPYIVKDEVFYFKDGNLTWMKNFQDTLNSKYLYYWLNSKFGKESLIIRAIGSSQAALTIDILKKYKFLLPERKVQDRIVEILSGYDTHIENNNKRIKLLEKMAEKLYEEWFVHFRFPGHENYSLKEQFPRGWVVASKATEMVCPEGWHYGKFSEIGTFVRGKNITAAEMVEGDIPVISAGLEPSGYHNANNVTGKSLTISASGANAGYLKYHLSDIWAADCSYCQDDKKLWFIYNALKFLQPVISNMQVGAAQPHVYPKNINRLCTIIPDDDTIQAYCDKVEPIYEQIKLLKDKNANLTKQRDMLLPRLMSGKLEV